MVVAKILGRLAVGSGVAVVTGSYLYNRSDDLDTPQWIRNIKQSVFVHGAEVLRETRSYGPPDPSPMRWDPNWDLRDPKSLVKPGQEDTTDAIDKVKAKKTRNIILIRHGQYYTNGATDADRYLTVLGREQAVMTGKRLSALGIKIDELIYSTMTRATETANIMREHMDKDIAAKADSLLEEGSPFRPEPGLSSWRPDAKEFLVDGTRIEAAFRKHIHRAKPSQETDTYEVYVCHANVIRYFVCRALQYPPEGWLRMSLAHGSITWLVLRPSGNVSLKSLGDSGHMPPDKVTYS